MSVLDQSDAASVTSGAAAHTAAADKQLVETKAESVLDFFDIRENHDWTDEELRAHSIRLHTDSTSVHLRTPEDSA